MSAAKRLSLALLALAGLLLSALWSAPASVAAANESYRFAVVPQFEQRKLFGIWKPIIDEVKRRTGVPLELVATLGVPEFEKALSRGEFDFAYANPYHIYREALHQGYVPLVRDSVPLRGILVVQKDSSIRTVDGLDGKVLAVPSPNALGASLLIRAELERMHGVKMSMLNARTHSSVYLHVANGLTEAGGGVEKTLQEQPASVKEALRILHTTEAVPSHPIAAHPRVPKSISQQVQRAFLDMDATPAGRALLSRVPFEQVVTTSLREYDVMRRLGLESFWVNEKSAP